MTNARTSQMMGDPPHRTEAIADVLAERELAVKSVPHSLLTPPKKGRKRTTPASHATTKRQRRHADLQARASQLWEDGYSVGLIASLLNLSLAKAYEFVHGEVDDH